MSTTPASGPHRARMTMAGVIGAADATEQMCEEARAVGQLLARNGYALVCGGRTGVMEASARGAQEAGGLVVGIMPGPDGEAANPYVNLAIATNIGHARNAIIAHTAEFLVAIAGGPGTLSEIGFGLKLGKAVYGIRSWRIDGVRAVADAEELALALAEDGWLTR